MCFRAYKMSIFGVKRKHVDTLALKQEISNMRRQVFPQINDLIDRHTELKSTVREMNINHGLLGKKVENIPDRKIISVCAESKGALKVGEVFSFGNNGKEVGAGYVMSFPGQILGIGLSCAKTGGISGGGIVSVIVSINGIHQTGYGTILLFELKGYDNFDKPLKVEAGDVIEFISMSDSHGCIRTVVSMIIELFI